MTVGPHVYDKAKYHAESVEGYGLSEEHAYHHTTFFFSWLVANRLMSEWFEEECAAEVEAFREGRMHINTLYEQWDCCLISDMLSDEGNAFAMAYFEFDEGNYIKDYINHLQKGLPSEFHVSYTPENERIIHAVINRRYMEWKTPKRWWQFWK